MIDNNVNKIDYKWKILFVFFVAISVILFSVACSNKTDTNIRIALFNIWEMSTEKLTEIDSSGVGQNEQLLAAAEIIRKVNPDILIINEIDHDVDAWKSGESLALNIKRFTENYLNPYKNSTLYQYYFIAPCNTGILSNKDLDNNNLVATEKDRGTREYGGDSYGYGEYPGQYSMAILSKFPVDQYNARTFQKFLWKDLPENYLPTAWYSRDEIEIFRLSSKSHWDVPVKINGKVIHLLVSHPTPSGFDGPEDRNGKRNYDEIKFWTHYLNNDSFIYDDAGNKGGLPESEFFILAGDLNAAPNGKKMESGYCALDLLLNHPRITDCANFLVSQGALMGRQPGAPDYIEQRTIGWGKRGKRIDHLFPSTNLTVFDGAVFWPDSTSDPEGFNLAKVASDHRLIWLDLKIQ